MASSGQRELNPRFHRGRVARCRYATPAWSLSPVPTRAPRPYRGHGDADPKGMSWAPGIRTPNLTDQSRALCQLSYRPSRAAIRCRAEPPALQEQGHSRVWRHWVRPPGLEPGRLAAHQHLGLARLPFRHEHRRAATRGRTGSSAVRRRSRSRARRQSCPPWIRTTTSAGRVRRPAGWTQRAPSAEAGLEPAAVRY